MPPRRIASLLPAATEMLCLLGRRPELLGISHECDHPPGLSGLPVLTRPRVELPRASGGIDRSIRELLRQSLSVFELRLEELERLRPEVIVTQDLCEVCAVGIDAVRAALCELSLDGVLLLRLHPRRFGDLFTDLRRLGAALGADAEAEAAIALLGQRVEAVRERASARSTRPAVLTLEWLDPVMVGGTWMPELVELAGGRALVARPGESAPTLDRAALAALDPAPEVVLLKPCGFPLGRTLAEAELVRALLSELPWPALRTGRVFAADGNAYFNRPGPRLVDSLEILAALIHPDAFPDLARRHADAFLPCPMAGGGRG